MKKYKAKDFKDNFPEWKRKRDSIVLRCFYRPISFYLSAIVANLKIKANSVSYFSSIIAILGCICFVFGSKELAILGAILFNIWLLLDCVDGNLARTISKQPFGDFADAMSSYILVGFMSLFMGIYVYINGGIIVNPENMWILVIGALASEGDTLMRLVYQKYKSNESELIKEKVIKKIDDTRTNKNKANSLRVRIEMEFGLAGIIPMMVLLGTIFNCLDIIIIYCFIYYFGSCVVTILNYVKKAQNLSN